MKLQIDCSRMAVLSVAILFLPAMAPRVQAQLAAANAPSTTEISSTPNSQTATDTSGPTLRLGAGDLLDISVYGVPDLSTKARIGSNGDIYLPLIDHVEVAGMTINEAQTAIEKRFTKGGFLVDPHVTVLVEEYASQGVNVLGAVNKPGVYPVLGRQRLLDVVAAAGGLSDRAGQTAVLYHKEHPDLMITVSLRENALGDDNNAALIQPGDTIVVKRADVVYVVGDVGHPSGLIMDGGNLTVLQAIALVGGTTRTAKMNGVKIIHKGDNGMTEISVPLKKILQAKAPDVPMQPNDILFVPSSAAKTAMAHSMNAIAQTASALTLVAVRP
jgi:polysaccharide export outer membrane protein